MKKVIILEITEAITGIIGVILLVNWFSWKMAIVAFLLVWSFYCFVSRKLEEAIEELKVK